MKEIYTSMIILTIKFPEKKSAIYQALFVATCLLILGA